MNALLPAVLIASLLGSTHCAGMCGAFLAFAVAGGSTNPRPVRLHAAYHAGRLVTYSLLGAVCGTVGRAVDLSGDQVGISRGAAVLAGGLMILVGLVAVLRALGVRLPKAPVPSWLIHAVQRGHRAADRFPPVGRALAVGLLTTLLPCGWLYAFAVTAAGTGDTLLGAATMAVFWAGTLPVLAGLGAGISALSGPLRARLPLITSLLLVAVGLFTVTGRLTLPAFARTPQGESPGAVSPTSVPSEPACCHEH